MSNFVKEAIHAIEARAGSIPWLKVYAVVQFVIAEEMAGKTVVQVVEDVVAKLAAGGF